MRYIIVFIHLRQYLIMFVEIRGFLLTSGHPRGSVTSVRTAVLYTRLTYTRGAAAASASR